jgi:hypothetical protein
MAEYVAHVGFGAVLLIVIEVAIWVRVCLSLSMKYKNVSFVNIIRHAPYRFLWLPKTITAVAELVIFSVSARYYQNGGEGLVLAITCFALLGLFGGLVFWEGVRAVRRYERSNEGKI